MRDNSSFKERILSFLDFKGVSSNRFYKEAGVSNGILSQKGGLSEDNLMKFLSMYPDVNLRWLILGEGEMIAPPAGKTRPSQPPPVVELTPGTANVVLLPNKVAASNFVGALTDPVIIRQHEVISLPKLKDRKGPFYALDIEGNSMHPTISHGHTIVGKPVPTAEFIGGMVYVMFHSELGLICKRPHWSDRETGIIRLKSDNGEIDDKEINVQDLSVWMLEGICAIRYNLEDSDDYRQDIQDLKKAIRDIQNRLN